jgi:hypothetical protein
MALVSMWLIGVTFDMFAHNTPVLHAIVLLNVTAWYNTCSFGCSAFTT